MSYTSIAGGRANIDANIIPNGNQEIDAVKVNTALNGIIDLIAGAGYTFLGVADPSTIPATPISDEKYFYLAVESGTYTNFNALSFDGYGVGIIKWNGAWSLERLAIPHGIFKISYANLKALKDSSQLIVGQEYEINDFETLVSGITLGFTTRGHIFNVRVTAVGTNQLSEIARASKIDGDTYFANNNLSAWKLMYCFDNDTIRFPRCAANGKGYIYRMVDEFNNDLPYDFKSIRFLYDGVYRETFYSSDTTSDSSLSGESHDNYMESSLDDGLGQIILPNVLGVAFSNRIASGFRVNYFTSVSGSTFGVGCADNRFADVANCVFGARFTNNIIGANFHDNVIGPLCNNNTIGVNFYENNIGSQFDTNTIGNLCIGCTFGNRVRNITTQGNIYRCSFGNGCRNITFQRTYAEFIEFSSGVEYIQLNTTTGGGTANQLRYFTILPSVSGASGAVRTISLDRNNTLYHFVDWDGFAANQICLATIGQ